QDSDALEGLAEIAHRLGQPDESRVVGEQAAVNVTVAPENLRARKEDRRGARRQRDLPGGLVSSGSEVGRVVVLPDARVGILQLVAGDAHRREDVVEGLGYEMIPQCCGENSVVILEPLEHYGPARLAE